MHPASRPHRDTLDTELGADGRLLFYCGTPPSVFPTIVRCIGEGPLAANARIVLEKPIGHDLASARDLDRIVREVFNEKQIFRIDHYMGKEAVQNILVFRFANSMVERAWSGDAVDHVQISVAGGAGLASALKELEEAFDRTLRMAQVSEDRYAMWLADQVNVENEVVSSSGTSTRFRLRRTCVTS